MSELTFNDRRSDQSFRSGFNSSHSESMERDPVPPPRGADANPAPPPSWLPSNPGQPRARTQAMDPMDPSQMAPSHQYAVRDGLATNSGPRDHPDAYYDQSGRAFAASEVEDDDGALGAGASATFGAEVDEDDPLD